MLLFSDGVTDTLNENDERYGLARLSQAVYEAAGTAANTMMAYLVNVGGQMMGRLLFRNDDERDRARKAGITDLDRVYRRDDMVTQDVIFAATGVTNGSIVSGARRDVNSATISSRTSTGTKALPNHSEGAFKLRKSHAIK